MHETAPTHFSSRSSGADVVYGVDVGFPSEQTLETGGPKEEEKWRTRRDMKSNQIHSQYVPRILNAYDC